MSRARVAVARNTRGTSEYQVLSAATLALVEQYQRRLDTIEDDFRQYHTEVQSYKAGVEHAMSELVFTQNRICTVLEHLPNQLQARLGDHAPRPPPFPPPRRRRRQRNRRRRSPSSLPSVEEAVDDELALADAGGNDDDVAESSSSDDEDVDSSDPDEGDENVFLADLWGGPAPVAAVADVPAAPPVAPVIPVPTVAGLRPPPVPISSVERLMATERVPDFDTSMPVSLVSLLADWRARQLGAYEKVKGKQSRWGISIAQAYGKRLYLMGLIRSAAPNAPRPDARPRTLVEMEDLAAVEMDRLRVSGGQISMASYYASRKRNDTRTDKRKSKNSSDEGGI